MTLAIYVFGSIIIVERALDKGSELIAGLLTTFAKLEKSLERLWDFVYLFNLHIIRVFIQNLSSY